MTQSEFTERMLLYHPNTMNRKHDRSNAVSVETDSCAFLSLKNKTMPYSLHTERSGVNGHSGENSPLRPQGGGGGPHDTEDCGDWFTPRVGRDLRALAKT